jgi:hypothetical protein
MLLLLFVLLLFVLFTSAFSQYPPSAFSQYPPSAFSQYPPSAFPQALITIKGKSLMHFGIRFQYEKTGSDADLLPYFGIMRDKP